MRSNQSSPLFDVIQSLFEKMNADDVTPKRLAKIIMFSVESRDGLLDPIEGEDPDWVEPAILDYTELIVRSNYKAHKIINGDLVPDDLEEQLARAYGEIPTLKEQARINYRPEAD